VTTTLECLRRPRSRNRIGWSVFALFLARAVVPVGYMPAALSEGGPIALCHGVGAATIELIESLDAGHPKSHAETAHGNAVRHMGHTPDEPGPPPSGHHDRWEHCPLGAGSTDLPVAPAVEFAVAPIAAAPARETGMASLPTRHVSRYFARAPPV
jgi:hypothetical protein